MIGRDSLLTTKNGCEIPRSAQLVSTVYVWDLHDRAAKQELKLEQAARGLRCRSIFRRTCRNRPRRLPEKEREGARCGGSLGHSTRSFQGMVRPLYQMRRGGGRSRGRPSDSGSFAQSAKSSTAGSASREGQPPGAGADWCRGDRTEISTLIVHQLFPALVQQHLNLSGTAYHVSIFSTQIRGILSSIRSDAGGSHREAGCGDQLGGIALVVNRPQGQRARRAGDPHRRIL